MRNKLLVVFCALWGSGAVAVGYELPDIDTHKALNGDGTLSYSIDGISGTAPFHGKRGEDISIVHTFKETPYTYMLSGGIATKKTVKEGGEFKINVTPVGKDSVRVSYTIDLARLKAMRDGGGIDLPDIKEISTKGIKVIERGKRENIFSDYNAEVNIVVF
ncbi:hypothetical protein ACLHZ0_21160 [Aeromonas salmonicida]|uniref:hypothetical protein n=1 Tax=Aeromonas salmonicida TaxID=645 RepID=UPI003D03DCB2